MERDIPPEKPKRNRDDTYLGHFKSEKGRSFGEGRVVEKHY